MNLAPLYNVNVNPNNHVGSNDDQKLADVHQVALKRFDIIQSSVYAERLRCKEDRRFASIPGAQWEGDMSQQFENRPRLEFNKIQMAISRLISEYRNNSVDVTFYPNGGDSGEALTDMLNEMYRANEADSGADEAKDAAFEEAVTGGFGAFRLRTAYLNESDDSEMQQVLFEPILDADACVYFDLDAKKQDKSDATHCFVLTAMSPDAYRDTYDEDPSSWNPPVIKYKFDWVSRDIVYVAEYYTVEHKKDTVYTYQDVSGETETYRQSAFDANPDLLPTLRATGAQLIKTKKIKVPKVHKYIMNGQAVIEDCGILAGDCIPIVPIYGRRFYYTRVPNIPPALAALLQMSDTDMQDLLGVQAASEQLPANTSGYAVELTQTKADMQTAIYLNNFAKGMKRCGEIWLGMVKDIMIEPGRKVRTMKPDGTTSLIELGYMETTDANGRPKRFDLSKINHSVAVEVGPTSTSKQNATVRALTGLLGVTQDPQSMQVITSMIIMNMQGEGLQDVKDYFRRQMVSMGAVKPTQEEAQQMAQQQQNQQPSPNDQFLLASAQQATAKAAQARADTELTLAQAEKARVDALATLHGMDRRQLEQAMKDLNVMLELHGRMNPVEQQQPTQQ